VKEQAIEDIPTPREEAQKALLDLFVTATGMPIGLYEFRDDRPEGMFSDRSLASFEPHCVFIRNLPGGLALCEADHCNRARSGIDCQDEQLTLCHAGLYNQVVPIRVGGEVRAALLYGEMRIQGSEYQQRTLARHRQAIARLGLNADQAAELEQLLFKTKEYTPEQLEEFKTTLPKVGQWFYTLMEEEDQLKHEIEKVSHEIQTRLQAVVANAENLFTEMSELTPSKARKRTGELLYSVLAMDTIVQNLGQYLEDFRFRVHPLAPLVYEAKRVYQAEAERRGIHIHIELQRVAGRMPALEISRHHLQYALNNLVHNAVKYSFRSALGRERYVKITGQPQGRYYQLTFENYGVGILPEEIKSGAIFRDGYQGRLTQGEYRTGSGKGLHFAKRIIERHYGRVEVESNLMADCESPEGQPHLTRFTVYLPYKQPREDSEYGQDHRLD
jgi:signal transduction histidine kinase